MRSKLLIITPCITTAIAVPICACAPGQTQAEKIANAIFNPVELNRTKLDKPFIDALKDLSQEELNNELLYDLFMCANKKEASFIGLDTSLRQLYLDQKVAIQTNITKCELKFDQDKLIANFLGYVSFIFTSDINDTFKINDYVMFTYDIKNLQVITRNPDFLAYAELGESYVLGFMKIRMKSSVEEHLVPISSINQFEFQFGDIPHNSKNWYIE